MCFGLAWVEQFLLWLVIVCAVVALLKLVLVPMLGSLGSAGSVIAQAINIAIWAFVCIAIIVLVFDALSCIPIGRIR